MILPSSGVRASYAKMPVELYENTCSTVLALILSELFWEMLNLFGRSEGSIDPANVIPEDTDSAAYDSKTIEMLPTCIHHST